VEVSLFSDIYNAGFG